MNVHNKITRENVMKVKFNELLDELWRLGGEQIPEGPNTDPEIMKQLDQQLAYFANMHAWITILWAYVSNETSKRKLVGAEAELQQDALKKKEALYEFASSLKLKWEAVSRRITVWQQLNEHNPDQRIYGRGGVASPAEPVSRPAVPDTQPRKSSGGWGKIG